MEHPSHHHPVSTARGTREPDAFRLHRAACGHAVEAVCEVWIEPDGWALRVVVSDTGVKWTARVTTEQARRETVDAWRLALVERGWV